VVPKVYRRTELVNSASEAGLLGELGEDVAGAAGGQPAAPLVEEQGGVGAGAGPGAAFDQPGREVLAQLGMDRDLAAALPPGRARDPQALAGGDAHVVDVESDGLADAEAGVERDQGEDPVAGVRAALHGAQPLGGLPRLKRTRRGRGQVQAGHVGDTEAAAGVEVGGRGEHGFDRGRFALDRLQMGARNYRGRLTCGQRLRPGVRHGHSLASESTRQRQRCQIQEWIRPSVPRPGCARPSSLR